MNMTSLFGMQLLLKRISLNRGLNLNIRLDGHTNIERINFSFIEFNKQYPNKQNVNFGNSLVR